MDLPDVCFCGCGERRSKLDSDNMEGVQLAVELSKWLNFFSIMKRAAPDRDWSQADNFAEDGKSCYRAYYAKAHEAVKLARKDRKLANRWRKFSQKSREGLARDVIEPGQPNPFEAPMPSPADIREWVFDDRLLPIEDPAEP